MRVAIVQRVLPHYRLPLFRRLRSALEPDGIHVELHYGQEYPGTVPATTDLDAPWALRHENRYLALGRHALVWQPCWRALEGADLVIVEQASRLLLNYGLLLGRAVRRRPRLAYWGHGRNFQSAAPSGAREALKRLLATRADWWFAYTELSAEAVRSAGFPEGRITVLDNTIDESELAAALASTTAADLEALRGRLGIPAGSPVGVFVGGVYPDKHIEFLLRACEAIRARLPAFHLLLVGDGPERDRVRRAAASAAWIHDLGPAFGAEKAAYLQLADVLLLPGVVGLAIIDSFVARTPLFTTQLPGHGPEIAYLRDGHNGVMTPHEVEEYSRAVSAFLADPQAQRRLQAGCAESAGLYTLDSMVEKFAGGIRACLLVEP